VKTGSICDVFCEGDSSSDMLEGALRTLLDAEQREDARVNDDSDGSFIKSVREKLPALLWPCEEEGNFFGAAWFRLD
jgi:hypothetical protein